MTTTPVRPQRLAVDLLIGGSGSLHLDHRTLLSLRTTNTIVAGSAKAEFTVAYDPADTSAWPYGLRAMDNLTVLGWAGGGPDTGMRRPLWTGKLDAVDILDDPQGGRRVRLSGSTIYKCFEVTTETPDQFQTRVAWSGRTAADVLRAAVIACGIDQQSLDRGIEDGPDLHTVPQPQIAGLNPLAIVNPQYLAWSEVVASVCTMAGRELYADEAGLIRYRLSHYDQTPGAGKVIPPERLLSTVVTLDTDAGLVNEVYVYYGLPQGGAQQNLAAHAGPVPGDDQPHYRRRALVLPAPWLAQPSDAQWYADWVLSWATHNRRPAVAALAFWPDAVLGDTYLLPWPPGHTMAYYVSSVVHDIEIGGAATTVLGLTYGRQPEVRWFTEPAPGDFGAPVDTPPGQGQPTPPEGVNWRITYYTTAGLPSYADGNGTYLLTADGTKLYQQGWLPPGGGQVLPYGAVRPCAFLQGYAIPELGGAVLSFGDQLYVESLGVMVECHDHIGTPVARGADTGRQLDVFDWSGPDNPSQWQDLSAVRYVRVAAANLLGPTVVDTTGLGSGYALAPWLLAGANGTPSASRLASAAGSIAPDLTRDGGGAYDIAPPGSDLAQFVATVIAPESGIATVQCTVFVLYLLIFYGGFPGLKTGPKTLARWPNGAGWGDFLAGLGWQSASNSIPRPGDVVWFSPGQVTSQGVVQDLSDGAGHVAIVTAVTPPTAGGPGTVQVAQSNVRSPATPLQSWTLAATAGGYAVTGPADGSFFGASVAGWMRYPGAQ